jgi:prepilin-type N-terminal cleavage/methylation domain-containing protein
MTKKVSLKQGFTLLEILLVVGIIAILAGIVILAINPTKQLGDARNAQRRSDVLTILNAVYQYSLDNQGVLTDITDADGALEDDTAADCNATNGTDALQLEDKLTATSTYLTSIPTDPSATSSDTVSEYYLVRDVTGGSGRITVCAPLAENGVEITVTR